MEYIIWGIVILMILPFIVALLCAIVVGILDYIAFKIEHHKK